MTEQWRSLSPPRSEASSPSHTLVSAARHAFVHGWSTSMWIGATGMFLLLLLLSVRAPHPAISALPTPDQQDPS